MTTTHVVFVGGTKDGTTYDTGGIEGDMPILFDPAWEPHEMYTPTGETRLIDGIDHVVYQLSETSPSKF